MSTNPTADLAILSLKEAVDEIHVLRAALGELKAERGAAWIYVQEAGLAEECNLQHAKTLTGLIHQMAKTIDALRAENRRLKDRVKTQEILLEDGEQIERERDVLQKERDHAFVFLGEVVDQQPCGPDPYGYCLEHNAGNPCGIDEIRKFLDKGKPPVNKPMAAMWHKLFEAEDARDKALEELAALREQTRVRDARTEKPGDYEDVFVFDGRHWFVGHCWDKWWTSSDLLIADFPFWLPMPPAPEIPR